MIPSFSFKLYEKPQRWPRPWVVKGRYVNISQGAQKETLRRIFTEGLPESPLFPKDIPLKVSFIFSFRIPVSWSRKKASLHEDKPYISRPDTDNLLKFYLDVLNGWVYEDDCQAAELWGIKKWAPQESVEGIISPL